MNKLEHKDRLSVTGYKRAEVAAASGRVCAGPGRAGPGGHGRLMQPPHGSGRPEPVQVFLSHPLE